MPTFPNDQYDLEFVYNEREAWEDDIGPYMEDVREAPMLTARFRALTPSEIDQLKEELKEARKIISPQFIGTWEVAA